MVADSVSSRGYGDDMADVHARIDSLKDDIRVIGDSVLDLLAKVTAHDAKFEQILGTLASHDARLAGHDARFDEHDRRFDEHDRRFDEHDRRFDEHDRRFDQIDAQLAEILARLPQRSG